MRAMTIALGVVSVSALALLCRLFLLPGARRARLAFVHRFLNSGRVKVEPRRFADSERLSRYVIRVMGMNPGSFTLQGSNTYLVGTGRNRLLVDTGEGRAAYLKVLVKVLRQERATLDKIIITHAHFDHVGGLLQLRKKFPKATVYKFKLWDKEKDIDGGEYRHICARQQLSVDGATVRVLHTPGHTRDHVALYLQEDNALFTGDCVLGQGTAVFESLHMYMNSLYALRNEAENAEAAGKGAVKLYPGHGDVVKNGMEHLEQYIRHRQLREDQILEMLEEKSVVKLEEAVNKIYEDQHLNFILKVGARRALRQHFDKLEKDGEVKRVGWKRWKRTA